jgi:hypothetical protein
MSNKNSICDFLNNYRCPDSESNSTTHLSYGKFNGKFKLDKVARKEFMKLYKTAIENGVNDLSILEKQLEYGPILIDIDIKQKKENYIEGRLYTEDDIESISNKYVQVINKYFDVKKYKIGVFEKPKPTIKENEVKDGFHLVISDIIAGPDVKHQIRKEVIELCELDGTFSNSDNDINDIIDKAVVSTNSWFLYGSVKPGCEAYKLSYICDNNLDKYLNTDYTNSEIINEFSVQSSRFTIKKALPLKIDLPTTIEKPVQIQSETSPENMNEIKLMVSEMKDYSDDNENWRNLGFILHNESDGSIEGLKVYDELSKQFDKYNKTSLSKFWSSIKPKSTNKMTIKTLYMWYYELFPEKKPKKSSK